MAVALLRGINVGRNRRIKMADLREALTAAGFGRVRTVLQSGNVVLDAPGASPEEVERRVHDAVLAFSGFDVAVLVRTADELAAVVERSPMPEPPDGARYVVVFLAGPADDVELPDLPESTEETMVAVRQRDLRVVPGRPAGVAGDGALRGRRPAVPATVRNWNTVTALARLTAE